MNRAVKICGEDYELTENVGVMRGIGRVYVNGKIWNVMPIVKKEETEVRVEVVLVKGVYKFENPATGVMHYITSAPALQYFKCFEAADGYRGSDPAPIRGNNTANPQTCVIKYVIFSGISRG